MEYEEQRGLEPNIVGVRIFQHEDGHFGFSFRHSGELRLGDYEELDLEVSSARLVRKG